MLSPGDALSSVFITEKNTSEGSPRRDVWRHGTSTNGKAERIDLLVIFFVLQELQFKMVALKELLQGWSSQTREKQDQLVSLYKAKPDHALGERASCDR